MSLFVPPTTQRTKETHLSGLTVVQFRPRGHAVLVDVSRLSADALSVPDLNHTQTGKRKIDILV